MKCKWYADFEGVCTNGECPYRGDTCPTSEHQEVCRYAEEKPKPEMDAEELLTALRVCAGAACEGCPLIYDTKSNDNCENYIKQQAADTMTDEEKDELLSDCVFDNCPVATVYAALSGYGHLRDRLRQHEDAMEVSTQEGKR